MRAILIAADHAGFKLKEKLKTYLAKTGYKTEDLGAYSPDSCDYPDSAARLAFDISGKKYKQGILICKSGIGNSIVANRFPGVRAALCYNVSAARLSRAHNDSNVLVLGSAFVNERLARRILKAWLNTEFQGGRHRRRLSKIRKVERAIRSKK